MKKAEVEANRQRKTFTKWINSQFARANRLSEETMVNELEEDLKSGIRLIKLLSIVSPQVKVPKYTIKPKMSFQMAENCNAALDMIRQANIKVVGIGSDNIVQGNTTLVLGLVWSIIYAIQIGAISAEKDKSGKELKGKDGLLMWCQRQAQGYEGVDIQNFTSSWTDGLALAAIIHHNRPDLIDFAKLKAAGNPAAAIQECFEVAARDLKIPPLLEVEDMLAGEDEKINMTYISEFYRLFSRQALASDAARKVSQFVQLQEALDERISTYEAGASEWTKWLDSMEEKLLAIDKPEAFNNTLEDASAKMKYVNAFRSGGARQGQTKKNKLVAIYNHIQTSSKTNHRKPYETPKGIPTGPEMHARWSELEKKGWGFYTFCVRYFNDQKAKADKEYAEATNKLHDWIKATNENLEQVNGSLKDQLGSLQNLNEQVNQQPIFDDAQKAAQKLESCGLSTDNVPGANHNWADLQYAMDELKNNIAEKKTYIEMELAANEATSHSRAMQDKMNDYKEMFNAFDINHTNALGRDEFQNCMKGLGIDVPDDELEALFKKYAIGADGIPFDSFINFMVEVTGDAQTKPQVMRSFVALTKAGTYQITPDELAAVSDQVLDFCSKRMAHVEGGLDFKTYLNKVFEDDKAHA